MAQDKVRTAVLDANRVLIGTKLVAADKVTPDHIDAGDLPADGRYRHDAEGNTFVPVGHGHGKPDAPPVSRDQAVYLALRALLAGTPIPDECRVWCDWYERNVK